MPLDLKDDSPTTFPAPRFQTLSGWKRGVITLINSSKLPKDALETLRNMFLVEDGQPRIRPGVSWFGLAPSNYEIDGFDYFDYNGTIHLVLVAGGTVYRSTDDGVTWDACTGASLTIGAETNMNQNNNYLYLTNGVDNIVRYNGTTTLQVYTSLTTPAAPTGAVTGLSGTTYTVYYKYAVVNEVGWSIASPKLTKQVGAPRESWDSTSNFITLTFDSPQASQTRIDIYYSTDDLTYNYLDSIVSSTATPNVKYKDDGTAVVVPGTTAPTENTTQGPKVEELKNIGSRQYGVRDQNNRYRIWFTGTGTYSGAFSSAYDGGYLDWQPGGKYIPMQVEDYRDGKGTPLATIWCDSADGQGCILQMSLDVLTIQDISITVPNANRLPGSRGTGAPGSVVNVLNDFVFYNSQAFYNLGSRAQFLNLLSTDESSANIRPTVRTISAAGQSGIASVYYDAKIYFSVPYGEGQTTNNYTAVYDTEMKAWIPEAFTLGFKKFLRYTDTTGTRRLLAVKPGDSRLSEINDNIEGDYGAPIRTLLKTGLYPATDDRFEFFFSEEAEIELSEPNDTIQVDFLGIGRDGVLRVQATRDLNESTVPAGWSTFAWSTKAWSDTSDVPTALTTATVKRYFTTQKEINAYQWRIITNSISSTYILRTLQTHGTDTEGGKPAAWRLPKS